MQWVIKVCFPLFPSICSSIFIKEKGYNNSYSYKSNFWTCHKVISSLVYCQLFSQNKFSRLYLREYSWVLRQREVICRMQMLVLANTNLGYYPYEGSNVRTVDNSKLIFPNGFRFILNFLGLPCKSGVYSVPRHDGDLW